MKKQKKRKTIQKKKSPKKNMVAKVILFCMIFSLLLSSFASVLAIFLEN